MSDPWLGEDRDQGPDRPDDAMALLGYLHCRVAEIDENYTFGDLISLLRGVEDIERLSPLLECDIGAFLAEGDDPPPVKYSEPLRSVEVRNVAVLTAYDADPVRPDEPRSHMDDDQAAERDRIDAGIAKLTGERPPRKLIDATGDDPVTGEPQLQRLRVRKRHGRWKPPYQLTREFEGRGRRSRRVSGDPAVTQQHDDQMFALDFTPLSALLHTPLQYNPDVQFSSGPLSGVGKAVFETELTITFGEFLHAIFSTLGFHGSPRRRNEVLERLRERIDALDRLRDGEE